MGEDENSEDWFSSEEVVTGSFSREQLRVWGEYYLNSSGTGTTDEKISSICLRKDTKIFLFFKENRPFTCWLAETMIYKNKPLKLPNVTSMKIN